jgi:hypothetical protein
MGFFYKNKKGKEILKNICTKTINIKILLEMFVSAGMLSLRSAQKRM